MRFGIKILHNDKNDASREWADEIMQIAAVGYACSMVGDDEWHSYYGDGFADDKFVELHFLNEPDRNEFVKFLSKHYPNYDVETIDLPGNL